MFLRHTKTGKKTVIYSATYFCFNFMCLRLNKLLNTDNTFLSPNFGLFIGSMDRVTKQKLLRSDLDESTP